MRRLPVPIALAAALLASACATTPGSDAMAQRDPLEKINRPIYTFNRALDKAAVRPAARTYVLLTPESGRRGISNFFENVDEPWTAINALLQAKPKVALRAVARFLINTTLGVGGLADHATFFGIERQEEDFGQTLAVWGFGSGPFLMVPLLGPSTLRDGAGQIVELYADPYGILRSRLRLNTPGRIALTGVAGLDARARLLDGADSVLDTAADEYATLRSAFLQNRRNDIFDGSPPIEEDDWEMDAEADAAEGADAPGAADAAEAQPEGGADEPAPPADAPPPPPADPAPLALSDPAPALPGAAGPSEPLLW
jgi:phospholipid-binding lipoprotein MlaA